MNWVQSMLCTNLKNIKKTPSQGESVSSQGVEHVRVDSFWDVFIFHRFVPQSSSRHLFVISTFSFSGSKWDEPSSIVLNTPAIFIFQFYVLAFEFLFSYDFTSFGMTAKLQFLIFHSIIDLFRLLDATSAMPTWAHSIHEYCGKIFAFRIRTCNYISTPICFCASISICEYSKIILICIQAKQKWINYTIHQIKTSVFRNHVKSFIIIFMQSRPHLYSGPLQSCVLFFQWLSNFPISIFSSSSPGRNYVCFEGLTSCLFWLFKGAAENHILFPLQHSTLTNLLANAFCIHFLSIPSIINVLDALATALMQQNILGSDQRTLQTLSETLRSICSYEPQWNIQNIYGFDDWPFFIFHTTSTKLYFPVLLVLLRGFEQEFTNTSQQFTRINYLYFSITSSYFRISLTQRIFWQFHSLFKYAWRSICPQNGDSYLGRKIHIIICRQELQNRLQTDLNPS